MMKMDHYSGLKCRLLLTGLCFCAALSGVATLGQNAPSQQSPAGQSGDNPFPEDAPKSGQPAKQGSDSSQKPASQQPAAPAAKPQSDNPFPGEDTNAPIIPVDPGSSNPGSGSAGSDSRGSDSRSDGGTSHAPNANPDANNDPVRSPDGPVNNTTDDGFSSSRSGLGSPPDNDDADAKPSKTGKIKTRQQMVKEDLDVGSFYSDRKNWKAAQERFGDAFKLDGESADAVFGLAEAERHLENYDKAREHYELFLSYDPDGPHAKAARKALEEVEGHPRSIGAAKNTAPTAAADGTQPK